MKNAALLFLTGCLLALGARADAPHRTENILLVTIDGVRWQEVFRGVDPALLNTEHGGIPAKMLDRVMATHPAGNPAESRRQLMPFLWSVLVEQGQLFGNRDLGSDAKVANPLFFSYPGYNELLTGHYDLRIDSNAPVPNPNVTVLEWLNQQPGLTGRIVTCAAWQAFPAILNVERSGLVMWSTGSRSAPGSVSPRIAEIERWMDEIPSPWPNEHFDAFVYRAALDYVDTHHPRILYVALGETDEWAHARRYGQYLDAIHRADAFIGGCGKSCSPCRNTAGRPRSSSLPTTDGATRSTPGLTTAARRPIPTKPGWWSAGPIPRRLANAAPAPR